MSACFLLSTSAGESVFAGANLLPPTLLSLSVGYAYTKDETLAIRGSAFIQYSVHYSSPSINLILGLQQLLLFNSKILIVRYRI